MRRDVAAASRKCVALHSVSRSAEKVKNPGRTSLDSSENVRIAAENAHHGDKVVTTPKSLDVRFCGPEAAAENHIAKKTWIANFNRRGKGVSAGPPKTRRCAPSIQTSLPWRNFSIRLQNKLRIKP